VATNDALLFASAAAVLLGLTGLVLLALGRPTRALILREFTAYFLSPVAYVTLFAFLLITGVVFGETLELLTVREPRGSEFPMQTLLGSQKFWLVFLFIMPLLTMRSFAEERGTGSLELLLTAPIRDWQVVAGKYIASLFFYIVLWLPTLVYVPVLVNWDWQNWVPRIDPNPVLTTYLGAFLAGAMFLALGLLMSSLVKSQIVAALVTLIASLVFVAAVFVQTDPDLGSILGRVVYFLSVPEHFRRDFTRGIVDTRHLVLYGSVTLLCLFLTVRSLEARRLR
jgi:ABC-2 type transport system permease protein